jgi:4-amino-4-deoxy-L-arabinose transferase-like glycosyltransferase
LPRKRSSPQRREPTRHLNWWLWAAVGLAVAVRIAAISLDLHSVADDRRYDQLAHRLLETGRLGLLYSDFGYPYPGLVVAWRTPGYPVFLAGLYSLGLTRVGALVAQAGVGGLVAWLVFLLGRKLVSERVGLVAAFCYALSLHSILYSAQTMSETLAVALVAGYLALLVHRRYAWAGVVLGLAVLVRPACVFFMPALLIAAWYQGRGVRHAVVGLVAAALVVSPWLARNVASGVGPVLSTNEGYNLYVGNNYGSTGGWNEPLSTKYFARQLPEREANEVFRAEALQWIMAHPAPYLKLGAVRLARLFGYPSDIWLREVWGVKQEATLRLLSTPLVLFALGYGLGHARRFRLPLVALGGYSLGLAATFCDGRFQELNGPVMVIFLAAGVVGIAERLRRRASAAR